MQRELRFILKFRSDASRALKATAQQLVKMGVAAKGAATSIKGLAKSLLVTAAAGATAGKTVSGAMSKIGAGASRALVLLRAFAVVLGTLGLGIGLATAVVTVAQFGQAMSRVQAITGELQRDLMGNLNPTFEAINDTVRRLGATTVFTASQAASAFGLLSQAGFDAGEAIQATASVLNLAVVGAIDLASSATIVANSIRGFGLDASDAERVADVFAGTITKANTNVIQLGEALKFVAPIAASMKISIEEAAAAVGLLSDAGLKGTLAGTGLRRVLIGLATQTPKATKTLKAAGVSVENLQKEIAGGGGLVAGLKEFEGRTLSAAQAVDVFGLRGGPAFLVLQRLTKEAGSFTEALKLMEGRAREFAEVARDNLAGDLKILRSVIEDTILGTGGLNDAFRDIVKTVTGVIQAFAGTLDPLDKNAAKYREIATNVKTAAKAIKSLVIALIALKVLTIVSALGSTFAAALLAGAGAAGVATIAIKAFTLALVSTGIGAIVVGLGLAVAAFIKFRGEAGRAAEQMEGLAGTFDRTERALERVRGKTGKLALEQMPALEAATKETRAEVDAMNLTLRDLGKEIARLQEGGLKEVFSSEILTTGQKFTALFKGLLFGTDAAAEGVKTVAKQMRGLSQSIEPTVDQLNEANQEMERLGQLQEAQKALTEVNNRVNALRETLDTTNKAISAFKGTADESFQDFAIEIGDLMFGAGAVADLQRAISKELRATGLDIVIPQGLLDQEIEATKALTAAKEEEKLARIAAAVAGVDGGQDLIDNATTLVASAQATLATIEETKKARQAERAQIIANVTAVQDQTLANKAETAARKAALKTLKDLTMERNRFALGTDTLLKDMKFEKTLIGLTSDERELEIFSRELAAKATKAQIGDIEGVVGALVKERAELLRLQKIGPGFSKTLGNAFRDLVDEATNASNLAQQGFDAFFSAFDDQIRNFVTTGQVNFREFALTVLDELSILAIKAASLNIFKGILGQIPGGAGIIGQVTGAATGGGGGGGLLPAVGAAAGAVGGGVQELGENTLEVFRTGFTSLVDIGKEGLEQSLDIAKFLGSGFKTGFQFLLTGFTTVIGFLGTLLSTVFTAASTAAAFIVSGAVTIGSFLVATAVQAGALLVQGAQIIGNLIAGTMQALLGIIAIFAPIPFFSQGGISDRPGRTGRIPMGAFHPMAGFAGGGRTGEDTIPAMLAPGEAVVPLQGGAIPVTLTVPDMGQGSSGAGISVVVNIQTSNLESFRDSEQEIQSTMGEAIRQAQMRDR